MKPALAVGARVRFRTHGARNPARSVDGQTAACICRTLNTNHRRTYHPEWSSYVWLWTNENKGKRSKDRAAAARPYGVRTIENMLYLAESRKLI
jgi:hypothetical protein